MRVSVDYPQSNPTFNQFLQLHSTVSKQKSVKIYENENKAEVKNESIFASFAKGDSRNNEGLKQTSKMSGTYTGGGSCVKDRQELLKY